MQALLLTLGGILIGFAVLFGTLFWLIRRQGAPKPRALSRRDAAARFGRIVDSFKTHDPT